MTILSVEDIHTLRSWFRDYFVFCYLFIATTFYLERSPYICVYVFKCERKREKKAPIQLNNAWLIKKYL